MIKTQDLTKVYGNLHAINNLTLDLAEGDLFGYIGPNGSGKTTTMRILATLLQPTWGEASVCGYSIYTHPKEIRRADRLHARLLRRLRRHEGDRVPGVFRRGLSHQGAGAAEGLRRDARTGRSGLQARRLRHQPFPRHDAAARPGPRAAARSQGAAAGRAGQRPGPAGADRDSRAAEGAGQDWARRSWSPATSCPSWPTSATRWASSSAASCWSTPTSPT